MSTSPFPITEAQIVSLFTESICYGIYLVSLGHCLRALLLQREEIVLRSFCDIDWKLLIVTLSMAIFASVDVAFGLMHNINAFVFFNGPGGASAEFGDVSYWVNVMKTADYVAQTAIGDGILIYRLYVIYGRSWAMIVFPALLWAATLASGCALLSVEVTTKHSVLLENVQLSRWVDCMCVFTLVLNGFVTSLIIGKLWRVRADVLSIISNGSDKLKHVMRIILDSGLLYTTFVTVFFATTLARSNAQYAVSDMVVQIIGITFNLITIRVNYARGPVVGLLQSTLPPEEIAHEMPPSIEFARPPQIATADNTTPGSRTSVSISLDDKHAH